MRHVLDQRRCEEETLAQRRVVRPPTAAEDLRAGRVARHLDVPGDAVELLLRDDRADLALGIHRIADLQVLHGGHGAFDHLVRDLLVQEQARTGRAGLPLAREPHALDDAGDRQIEVGIGHDDVGALASELQRHGADLVRRVMHDLAPHRARPGERDLAYVLVLGERSAAFLAHARDGVDHAGREHLLRDLGAFQHGEGRLLGGLQDDRVACHDGGSDLAGPQQDRRVPRDDRGDHPDRVARGVVQRAVEPGHGVAFQFGRESREHAQHLDSHAEFGPRLRRIRVAGLQGFESGDVVGVLLDVVGELVRERAAFLGGHARPRPEGLLGRGDGAVDIGPAAAGRRSDDVQPGRVDHLEGLVGHGGVELAVDDDLVGQAYRVVVGRLNLRRGSADFLGNFLD